LTTNAVVHYNVCVYNNSASTSTGELDFSGQQSPELISFNSLSVKSVL